MAGKSPGKSRRKTPWDEKAELTSTARKVEKVVNLAFKNPKLLRYRD